MVFGAFHARGMANGLSVYAIWEFITVLDLLAILVGNTEHVHGKCRQFLASEYSAYAHCFPELVQHGLQNIHFCLSKLVDTLDASRLVIASLR